MSRNRHFSKPEMSSRGRKTAAEHIGMILDWRAVSPLERKYNYFLIILLSLLSLALSLLILSYMVLAVFVDVPAFLLIL